MLPHIDGLQLVTHIRAKTEWCEVPIVILTSDSTERNTVRALDAGANDYVIKPLNPKSIDGTSSSISQVSPPDCVWSVAEWTLYKSGRHMGVEVPVDD